MLIAAPTGPEERGALWLRVPHPLDTEQEGHTCTRSGS
jgi:hypothetical protein